MSSRLAAACFLALLLAGCATTPSPVVTTTAPPPGAAPLVSTSSDPRVATLAAAGVKPLAPAAISAYMSKEEQALRAVPAAGRFAVTRSGDQIVITLATDQMFDTGQSSVKPALSGALASIGMVLKQYDQTLIDVYCYTDPHAPDASARDLSQRRAVAAATQLANEGVPQNRFYIQGRGAAAPIATNATPEGRAQNRRLDIQISPVT